MRNTRFLAIVAMFIIGSVANVFGQCNQLFFSQYIEGTSNNKAVEIYNPGQVTVDLSLYAIRLYYNGASVPSITIPLSGTLMPDATYIVVNSSADPGLLNQANLASGSLQFNGNDAVELTDNGAMVDLIGKIGEDPGTQWQDASGNVSTLDKTLLRKPNVEKGIEVNPGVFNPIWEWLPKGLDVFNLLSNHGCTCHPVSYCNLVAHVETTGETATGASDGIAEVSASYSSVSEGFNLGINYFNLDGISSGTQSNICGSLTGDALLFTGDSARYISTANFNTQNGGNIAFGLYAAYQTFGTCENVDLGEDIVLEYSNNNGANWGLINTYNQDEYPNWTVIVEQIPLAAQTTSTQFRWRQLTHDGVDLDVWGLDDIFLNLIQPIGNYAYQWSTGGIQAVETGLSPGSFSVTITDGNGCTDVRYGLIEAFDCGLTAFATSTDEACFGCNDGTASVIGVYDAIDESFEGAYNQALWTSVSGGTVNAFCGAESGLALYFNGDELTPRYAETVDFNTTNGGDVEFAIVFGTSSGSGTCLDAEAGEDVVFEYSNNLGGNWIIIDSLDESVYSNWAFVNLIIPSSAQTPSTRFRWRQVSFNTDNDNWAIDEIRIGIVNAGMGFTYLWSNGDTTQSITGLAPGNYSVEIHDSTGCMASNSYIVVAPYNCDLDLSLSYVGELPGGAQNGSATAAPSNGLAPYAFLWSNGATTATADSLGLGFVSVTVTDSAGCQTVDSIEVLAGDCTLAFDGIAITAPTCFGDSNGQVSVSAVVTNSNLLSENFNAGFPSGWTIIDGDGYMPHSSTDHIVNAWTVLENPDQPGAGDSVIASTSYYQNSTEGSDDWLISPAIVIGAETHLTWDARSYLSGFREDYEVLISTTTPDTAAFNLNTPLFSIVDESDAWTSRFVDLLALGYANQTIYIAFHNTSTNDWLMYLDNISVNDVTTDTSNFSFAWSNGGTGTVQTGLSSGNISVTITDQYDCVIDTTLSITEPAELMAETVSTDETLAGANDGSALADATGGVMPYSFLWSNSDTTDLIDGLAPGLYVVTITDANGCTDTDTAVVNSSNCTLLIDITKTDNTSLGSNDGSATIVSSGGISPTYLWNTGATTMSIGNLSTGWYYATATDFDGCTSVDSVEILDPACTLVVSNIDINPILCNGSTGGEIEIHAQQLQDSLIWSENFDSGLNTWITVDGDTLTPYVDYAFVDDAWVLTDNPDNSGQGDSVAISTSWYSPAGQSNDWLISPAITLGNDYVLGWKARSEAAAVFLEDYEVRISTTTTDTTAFLLNPPLKIVKDENHNWTLRTLNFEDHGYANQTVHIAFRNVSNDDIAVYINDIGVQEAADDNNLIYSWSNGNSTNHLTGLGAGTYAVTITDIIGCSIVESVTLTQPSSISVNDVVTDESALNANDGSIVLQPIGGTSPYTYLWSNGATTASIDSLAPGLYTYTVTDANGCVYIGSSYVTESTCNLVVSLIGQDESNTGQNNGFVVSFVTGGSPLYTYLWSNGANTANILNASMGTYTVTVTDAFGCVAIDSFQVGGLQCNMLIDSFSMTSPLCYGDLTASAHLEVAQITYVIADEDFNSGIPSTWYLEDLDGLTPSFQTDFIDDAWVSVIDPVNPSIPDSAIASTSFYTPAGQANDWIISPAYTLGANSALTWKAKAHHAFYSDGYEVRVSTSGPFVMGFLQNPPLYTVAAESATDWVNHMVNLADAGYANQSVHIAFTNSSNDQWILYVDDIFVYQVNNNNSSFTYQWSNGQTGSSLSNVAGGVYTLSVTDAQGCTLVETFDITGPTQLSATMYSTDETVIGSADGTAAAVVTGGVAPYSYQWSNGDTISSLNTLPAGTYNLTVTDKNGCTLNEMVVVGSGVCNLSLNVVGSNETSLGAGDGAAVVTTINGIAPFDYLWTNGVTTTSINNLSPGWYWVTVSDGNGCVAIDSVQIGTDTSSCNLSVSVIGTNQTSPGVNDGTAIAQTTGGTAPITYLWSNAATSAAIINLAPGLYTVTVTDAQGCMRIGNVQIDSAVSCPLNVTIQKQDESGLGANDGSALVNISGASFPVTYNWSNGSTAQAITGLTPGWYYVTVTDNSLCTVVDSVEILPFSACQMTVQLSVVDESMVGAGDGAILANAVNGTPAYVYQWSNGATGLLNQNLSAGQYSLTVTDALGCTTVVTATVGEPCTIAVSATATNLTGPNTNDGTATAVVTGNSGAITYNWDNGSTTAMITGLSTGVYQVVVSDSTSCTDTAVVFVNTFNCNFTVDAFATDETGPGAGDGSAWAVPSGGVAPYTYLWSNGGSTDSIIGLTPGVYAVVASDTGCVAYDTVVVGTTNDTCDLNILVLATNLSAPGSNDGLAMVSASGANGPFTYLWSNAGVGASISNLSPGVYTVTVTDMVGCTSIDSAAIGIDPVICNLVLTPTITHETTNGANDGSVIVSASGGANPYTYAWSNGDNSQFIDNLSPGSYTATVTDALGCIDSVSVVVNAGGACTFNVNINATNESANGASDASAVASAFGGVSPYTYAWSNGTNGAVNSGLTAGTYTVTTTDNNGCISVDSVQIIVGSACSFNLTTSGTNETSPGSGNGTATAIASGGTSPYTYAWSNGSVGQSISGLSPQTYNVTATDAAGCVATSFVVIGSNACALSVNITGTDESSSGSNDGTATAVVTGGVSPISYQWSSGQNTQVITGLSSGVYTVTVADIGGCTDTSSVIISVAGCNLAVAITGTDETSLGAGNGSATASATGASGMVTYTWSNGQNGMAISGLSLGVYSVTATDSIGCVATSSVTIGTFQCLLQAIASSQNETVAGANDGIASVIGANGTAPLVYLWSTGDTTNQIVSGLAPGTYWVSVTDANSCSDVDTVVIAPGPLCNLILTMSGTAVTVSGGNDGTALVTPSGGVSPYVYLWNTGATTAGINNLVAGTYVVLVEDASGCLAEDSIVISNGCNLSVAVSSTHETAVNAQDGTVSAVASGGTTPYDYLWVGLGPFADVANVAPGTYDVIVEDAMGCVATAQATINKFVAVGLQDLAHAGVKILAYPIPAKYQLTLEIFNWNDDIDITIENALGQKVFSSGVVFNDSHEYKQIIDITAWSDGVYFIKANSIRGQVIQKIIVN